MISRKSKWVVFSGLIGTSALIASVDVNAQVTAYPAQGQTPQQQEMDKATCQDFAKGQTGFDPQQALAAAGQTAEPPPPGRPRKRAREEEQQQSQQKAQMEKKLQAYNKAEAICLKGKGYSVG